MEKLMTIKEVHDYWKFKYFGTIKDGDVFDLVDGLGEHGVLSYRWDGFSFIGTDTNSVLAMSCNVSVLI